MLDVGIECHANHFGVREYIAEVKYHKGIVYCNTDDLSLSISSWGSGGLRVHTSGMKNIIYNKECSNSFYLSPGLTIAFNIKFFKKGYLYYTDNEIVSFNLQLYPCNKWN